MSALPSKREVSARDPDGRISLHEMLGSFSVAFPETTYQQKFDFTLVQDPETRNLWQERDALRGAMSRLEAVSEMMRELGEVQVRPQILGDLINYTSSATHGGVVERHEVQFPRELLEHFGNDLFPPLPSFVAQPEELQPAPAPIRFPCGGLWYTLNRSLSREALASIATDLGLPSSAGTDDIERHLHFRFQRLYRKPTDQWTKSEAVEWGVLRSHVNVSAYEVDNPVPENRLGVILDLSANGVVIRWNTSGDCVYDPRDVPGPLLIAERGWIVHAMVRRSSTGSYSWIAASVEPPYETTANDSASLSIDDLPDADWPRAANGFIVIVRKFGKRVRHAARKTLSLLKRGH